MAFKDNLRMKVDINDLASRIRASMGTPDSGRRTDKDLVRQLLGKGGYRKIDERDMELYQLPPKEGRPRLLVLDNDLPIYSTSVEDVALRKSPVLKEMLNIRNVVKILNDTDVVVSKKEVSLETLREELIGGLDLRFTKADIEDLVYDGRSALENNYAEGVEETLRLFFELLGYSPAPRLLQVPHHSVWGAAGERRFGPLVLHDRLHAVLKRIQQPIDPADPDDLTRYRNVVAGSVPPDQKGGDVFEALGRSVLASPGPSRP